MSRVFNNSYKNRKLTEYMEKPRVAAGAEDRVTRALSPSTDATVEERNRPPTAPNAQKPSVGQTGASGTHGGSVSPPSAYSRESSPMCEGPEAGWVAGERQIPEEVAFNWFYRGDEAFVQGVLVSAYYDPKHNKAVLAFIDGEGHVKYWYDKRGHRPYFIVKEDPQEAQRRIPPNLQERIISLDAVVKQNLLYNRKESYTRVIVTDPLAVRELRGYFDATWESDIKYHQNYVYDVHVIPGLTYIVNGTTLLPLRGEEEYSGEAEELVADPSSRSLARRLLMVLEEPAQVPPMVALDVEVYSPEPSRLPDPSKADYPIVSVALAGSDGLKEVHVVAYPRIGGRKPGGEGFKLVVHDSELSLLYEVFSKLRSYAVAITYNGDNFDLPYLRNRAVRLGLRENEIPIIREQKFYTLKGAIHVDLYKVFDNRALKVYAFGGTYRENTLDAVASAMLGVGKIKLDIPIGELTLEELASYNFRDAEITLRLMRWKNFLTWKLLIVLARLSKTGVEELSRSQISSWIRNMLYWEHRFRNALIPSKQELLRQKGETRSKAIIKGKKYMGAVVLDPPVGVFFDVAVLDFASLYPSIVKVWNLSYETVNPAFPCKDTRVVPEVGHRVCFDFPGITAQLIGLLRDLRVKVYKKKSKDPSLGGAEREWYDVVQSSLKVFLNASYGVFGSETFALYTPAVAESVTAIGRDTIRKTLKVAEDYGLMVLYGDTDSMFVWSPPKEALDKLSYFVETELRLDLELDKVFRFVAFSGLKKNYLGVTGTGEVVIKGLLGKKRNQPEFLKKVFREVIEEFAKISSPDEFERSKNIITEKIRDVYRRLKAREYTLDELAFNVMINKPLREYKSVIPQHVKAALMLEALGKRIGKGDIVSYVKVRGKDSVKPVELAKLSEIDVSKYMEAVRSTFEQILEALNIEWKEIEGLARLESFF